MKSMFEEEIHREIRDAGRQNLRVLEKDRSYAHKSLKAQRRVIFARCSNRMRTHKEAA